MLRRIARINLNVRASRPYELIFFRLQRNGRDALTKFLFFLFDLPLRLSGVFLLTKLRLSVENT